MQTNEPQAMPSGFVQEGSPDSFANMEAKLKQLEDNIVYIRK